MVCVTASAVFVAEVGMYVYSICLKLPHHPRTAD